jgi:hypothetical protein
LHRLDWRDGAKSLNPANSLGLLHWLRLVKPLGLLHGLDRLRLVNPVGFLDWLDSL